jgi:hypothetical protein
VDAAIDDFREELRSADDAIEDRFSEAITDINDQRERIRARFEQVNGPARNAYWQAMQEVQRIYDEALDAVRPEIEEMEHRLVTQAESLLPEMAAALAEIVPDPDEFDWPEAMEGDENDDVLCDATRDNVEQVDVYRAHRGDDKDVGLAEDRVAATAACVICGKTFETANPRKMFYGPTCTKKNQRARSRDSAGQSHAK